MDGKGASAGARRIEAERRVLAALCQGALDAAAREETVRRLAAHRFAEPEHEVVFREAATLAAAEAGGRRAEMARRLTRAGFPDVALERFFDCEAPGAEEARALLEELEG